jgi:predicted nucleic acid-binding protein
VSSHQPRAIENLGDKLQRVSLPSLSPELQTLAQSLSLDQGEVEALGLLETNPRAWFLTDDAAARLVAEQRGYQVHGTIGLLIRTARRGQKTPRQVLGLLRAIPEHSTLFIRPDLLNSIIQRLEQEWLLA